MTLPFQTFSLNGLTYKDNTLSFYDDGNTYGLILPDMVSPWQYGAKADGFHDDTDAIERMFEDNPKVIYWGDYNHLYRITRPLELNFKSYWFGRRPMLRFDWEARDFIINMLRIKPGAEYSVIEGLIFDHDALGAVHPYMNSPTDLILMDAVRSECDDVTFVRCGVHRSALNGMSIQRATNYQGDGLTLDTAFQVTNVQFYPLRNRFIDCYAFECGYLTVTDKFRSVYDPALLTTGGGAGFNILSGSRNVLTGLQSHRCSVGLTIDFNAGAIANTVSNINITDCGYVLPGVGPAGVGMWVGAPCNTLSNISIVNSWSDGIVIAPSGYSNMLSNISCYNNGHNGYRVGADNVSLTNCLAFSNSLRTLNTYDGFQLSSASAAKKGIRLIGCNTSNGPAAQTQRYGLNIMGVNTLEGAAYGCVFEGVTGATNIGSYDFTLA